MNRSYALLPLLWMGCTVLPAPEDSPGAVFDAVWNDFDAHYGLFGVKPDVDWDAAYVTLRPQAENASDAELAELLRTLLDPLDDDHVYFTDFTDIDVTADDVSPWTTWEAPRDASHVDLDVIAGLVDLTHDGDFLSWGHLEPDVGYVRLHHFDQGGADDALERALDDLSDTDVLVLDIRDTPGGRDSTSEALAGCFVTEPLPYLTVRLRNGPERDAFSAPIRRTVQPDPTCRWDKPVALLTDAWTVSAGEVFTLALDDVPLVTRIGEHTTGSMSDVVGREAPNGWLYSISVGDWRDEDDVSWEGRGVPPHIEVVNTAEAVAQGRDLTIEQAVATLRSL